jgi:hypothetical protein
MVTNKTDSHDIAEILLKVALNAIHHQPNLITYICIIIVKTVSIYINVENHMFIYLLYYCYGSFYLKKRYQRFNQKSCIEEGHTMQWRKTNRIQGQTMIYTFCISQLKRYSRACYFNHYFLYRGLLLTKKLRNQGFLVVNLKS